MRVAISRFGLLLIVNIGLLCVLGFYQSGNAQSKGPQPGLTNSAAQRLEIIEQLKGLNRLVAEQNQLLRSGKVSVTIVEQDAR